MFEDGKCVVILFCFALFGQKYYKKATNMSEFVYIMMHLIFNDR